MEAYHEPRDDRSRDSFGQLLGQLGSVLGCLSVAATLALSMPGVVAHADPQAQGELVSRELEVQSLVELVSETSATEDASVCRAGQAENQVHATGRKLALLQQRMMARAAADAAEAGRAEDEIVVLNGRGYGYAPRPEPSDSLQALQREVRPNP